MKHGLAAFASMLSLANAGKTFPNFPVNAQAGALNFSTVCDMPLLGAVTFPTWGQATGPISIASGQQSYLGDLAVKVTIPALFTTLAALIGAKQASVLIHVEVKVANGIPPLYVPFPNGLRINNISLPAHGPLEVAFPTHGVVEPTGPVAADKPGVDIILSLGSIRADITVQGAHGNTIFGPITINCDHQLVDWPLGLANVGPKRDPTPPPLVITNGEVGKYPIIPFGYQTGVYTFPYQCDLQELGSHDIVLALVGTVGAFFHPGQSFAITDAEAFLNISATTMNLAVGAFPGTREIRVTSSEFLLSATNASPNSINALSKPLTAAAPAKAGEGVTLAFPPEGVLEFGPFTAGESGTDIILSVGNVPGTVQLIGENSEVLYSTMAQCRPTVGGDIIKYVCVS